MRYLCCYILGHRVYYTGGERLAFRRCDRCGKTLGTVILP